MKRRARREAREEFERRRDEALYVLSEWYWLNPERVDRELRDAYASRFARATKTFVALGLPLPDELESVHHGELAAWVRHARLEGDA